ncbi:MAG: hypothetical protein RIK87_13540 [Fuerstiella sp.]
MKCRNVDPFWEEVYGIQADYVSAGASQIAFFAKYPAALADEMVTDYVLYADCTAPPTYDEDMHLNILSSLVWTEERYRVVKALLPSWPFDYRVCLHLREAILSEDSKLFHTALEAVRKELIVFGYWLRASGQWENRPNNAETNEQQNRRECYFRDHTFLKWRNEGMTPAKIRDRWNREYPEKAINLDNKSSGRDVVKQGIKNAEAETKDLLKHRGIPR